MALPVPNPRRSQSRSSFAPFRPSLCRNPRTISRKPRRQPQNPLPATRGRVGALQQPPAAAGERHRLAELVPVGGTEPCLERMADAGLRCLLHQRGVGKARKDARDLGRRFQQLLQAAERKLLGP